MEHNVTIDLNDLNYMNLKNLVKENHISLSKLFEKFASDLIYGEKSNGGNQRSSAKDYLNSCQYDLHRVKEPKKELL